MSVVDLLGAVNIPLLLAFGVVLLLSYWLLSGPSHPNIPGPPCLPLIGSLPFLLYKLLQHGAIYKLLIDWQKKYGDIYCVGMGSQKVIVINGYKYLSKVLREKAEFINGRPYLHVINVVFKGEGLSFSDGPVWHDMRKFVAVTMRGFGLGKRSLEQRIQDEARITMEMIADLDEPFLPREILLKSVSNIICGICFGQRFEYSDPEFSNVLTNLHTVFRTIDTMLPENFFPWLENVPVISKIPTLRKCHDNLMTYVANQLRKHEESFDADNIRDFMDLYIDMKQSGENKKSITDTHLFQTMIDLFLAGGDTTATTLSWLFAYMLRYPQVHVKCQQEIDQVVGSGRMVSLSDKPNLTYNMAVINEVQRLASTVPHIMRQAAVKCFELGGYLVPKDSSILINLRSALRDETYWEAAEEFQPERWIDEDGNLKIFDAFMPFSLGPRACPGKQLADMEVYLFFTNFLRSFTFKLPEGTSPPSLEGVQTGAFNLPEKYHLVVEKRK